MNTKLNSFESIFGTVVSAGFSVGVSVVVVVVFRGPNEKLNVDEPNVFGVVAVDALAFCAAPKLPKLNFGAPAE